MFSKGSITAIFKGDTKDFDKSVDNVSKSFGNLDSRARRVADRIADLERKKSSLIDRMKELDGQNKTSSRQYRNLQDRVANLSDRIATSKVRMTELGNSTKKTAWFMSPGYFKVHVLANALGNVLANAVQVLTSKMFDLGKTFFGLAAETQNQSIAFETMLGSAEKAEKLFADLNAMAVKTPFDIADLRTITKQMLAYGIPLNKVVSTTEMLGDITAGTGGDLNLLGKAYGQVKTKGKLYTQELNQLGEQGLAVRDILAKDLGVSVAELMKGMESGKISVSFQQFEKVIKKIHKQKFLGLMAKQSETASGMLQNLGEQATLAGQEILGIDTTTGKIKVGSVFDLITQALQNTLKFVNENKEAFINLAQNGILNVIETGKELIQTGKELIEFYKQNKSLIDTTLVVVGSLVTAYYLVTTATWLWTIATNALTIANIKAGIAMLTSPVGLTIVAIGLLIAGIILLVTNWETVTTWLQTTWQTTIDKVNETIDTTKNKFQELVDVTKKKFEELKTSILDFYNTNKPLLDSVFVGFTTYLLLKTIPVMIQFVRTVFTQVIPAVARMVVTFTVNAVKAVVKFAVTLVTQTIPAMIQFVIRIFTQVIPALITLAISFITQTIPAVVGMAIAFVSTAIPAVVSFAIALFSSVIPALFAMAGAVWAALGPFGLIAIVVGLLYLAWTTNFLGIRDITANVWGWLKENWFEAIKTAFLILLGPIGWFVMAWQNNLFGIQEHAGNAWKWLKANFINMLVNGLLFLLGPIGWLVMAWRSNFLNIQGITGNIVGGIMRFFSKVGQGATDLKNSVVNAFKNIGGGIANGIRDMINSVISNFNRGVGSINSMIDRLPDFPGSDGIPRLPEIPKFNKGVENFEGGLAYVHRGEVLMNLPKNTDVLTKSQVNQSQKATQQLDNYTSENSKLAKMKSMFNDKQEQPQTQKPGSLTNIYNYYTKPDRKSKLMLANV